MLCAFSLSLAWSQQFFPLKDVRPGLRGVGKTVFQGDRIEEFQVEILGVLEDFGPKQPIILARLSGGPLAETGVLQGMSGSPVYIEGKLLGAVALGFPFSKEPICGIQPIQSMIDGAGIDGATLNVGEAATLPAGQISGRFDSAVQLFSLNAARTSLKTSPLGDMSQILTPLSFSGFTPKTVTGLDPALRRIGFSAQPLSAHNLVAASSQTSPPKPMNLQPGSMISVGLITGDWNMTADGTVTYIDGNKIYAFGHRLLGLGATEVPLAFSAVIACIPATNSSFKISSPRQWIGTILSDHATAIAGELGRTARTIPVEINVNSGATGAHSYRLSVVNDRLLTPFLTQAALFSTLDATERSIGTGTLKLQGEIRFEGNLPPLNVNDIFVTDSGLAQQAAADAVVELAFALGGGFRDLRVKNMSFRLDELDTKKQLRLAQVWTSAHDVRAGETVDITAVLQAENGVEVVKTIPYHVPEGAPLGPLNMTLSDGNTLNFPEFAGIAQTQFRTAASLIDAVNRYRGSAALYIRIWRQQTGFNVAGPMPGGEISDPPPSVALILADTSSTASSGATANTRGSDVAQLSVDMKGYVVTGAKTIQIEVKE